MKTLGKKLISMVLLLSMLLSAVPMEVLAATVNAQPHVHAALYEEPGETPQDPPEGTPDVTCEYCGANITKGEIHRPHCASLAEGFCTCLEDNHSNLHDSGCSLYVPVCTCNAEEDAEHKPGCEILARNSGCICTLGEDDTHKSACPLYVPHCDCQAAAAEEHRPGCDILKHTENCICSLGEIEHRIGCPLLTGCTCKPGLSAHAHGCSLHECKCDCGKTEDETDKPGCHLLKYTEDGSACTCALGAERHGTDCPLYQDEGCTCDVFGYGTPHTNACDLRYALCNCGTPRENENAHKDGCPLYIPQCNCGTTTDEHTSDCATQQPICSCGAGRIGENNKVNHYHAATCPLYEECKCTSGSNDTKYHDSSCPLYLACTCKSMSNATKYHEKDICPLYLECDCDSDSNDTKYHQPSCPLYVECECSQHSNDTKYHIPTCPLYVECTCGAGIDSRDHTDTCPLYVGCTCGAVAGIPHDPTCPRYMKPCSCGAPKGGPHQNGCTRYSNEIVQPTEKTLQALINEANSNGGVVTWHTPGSNIYEDINIPVTKKGLVVDLQGATLHPAAISGRAAGTGLVVNNINVYGDATFKNGTIDGTGLTNARGVLVYSGAHFGAGDDLTISNFTVESSGGGIRVDKNAGLYLSSTANICNNTARDLGGGVYIYDGAQLTLDAAFGAETVNEKPVGIHHNTATYGGGIAMYVINEYINEAEEGEEKLGVMRNLSLRYNKAISGGGGLYVTSYAYVNFVNMVLEKNTSDTNGGAAMFASNVDLKFTDFTMTDNVAATAGGGMYITGWSGAKANSDNKVEIINPNIYNNTAGYGGAIYGYNRMEVDIHADESTTDATKKRLSSNTALTGHGGAMRFNSYATVSLTNLDIKDNVSEVYYGGVLYTTTAMKLELRDVDVQNSIARQYGGAFFLGTSNAAHTVNIYSGNFENNRVSSSQGGNEGRGGVFYLTGGTLNVYGGRFYNNYAQYYGGAIFKENGTTNIYSGTFDSNRVAYYDGGAIYTGGTTTIKLLPLEEGDNPQVFAPAVVFTKNNARYGGSIGQNGGSITVAPDVILATGERLISAHFTECKAWSYGCGIYTASPAYIHGGLYEKATAGGPVVWGYNGTVTADGGEFTDNAVYSIGTHDGTVNIEANASDKEHNGVWVHDNRNTGLGSTNTGAFNIHGGVIENNSGSGVYCDHVASIRMDGGIVRNNTGNGLAIGNYVWDRYGSSVTVSGGLITGNRTRGILGATVTVSGGTISNNGSAAQSGNGGGIYGNKITITGGTITGNTATYGGGIYCGPGNIDRRNNSASVGGKYLFLHSRSDVSITGGTIQDNTAGYLGNDIFVMEPENKIITETISPSYDATPAEYSISFALAASKNMTDPETRAAYSESPEKVTAWYDEIDKLNLQDKIDPRRHLDPANKMWDAYTFVYAGEEKYVAQIGGVKYTTLQAAFDAIKAGEAVDEYGEPCSDIFMIDNTLENVVVPDGITATLDLRGKQVRCGVGTVLTVNGAITLEIMDTVRDSKGNVKGEISGATTSGIAVGGGASVTISGGNVCNNSNTETTGAGGGIRVDDGGTVRITGTARIHDNGMPMDGRGGGGIGVMKGGVLNMDGGTIDKNTVTKKTNLAGATAGTGIGAGVYVLEGGTFNMSGGTISDNLTPYNRGSGVAVRGAFNMTGGKITNNSAGQADNTTKNQSWGGAVYVVGTGVFTMSANAENPQVVPEITNNKGNWGAGVLVMDGGLFTMNDGLIKGNVCPEGNSYNSGGGVFLYNDNTKFTMNGGVIEENIANEGGGMTMYYQYPAFVMNGGIIRNNTARTSYGGAICVSTSHHCGPLTMNGGVITGNTAKTYGGGIFLGRKATFNMTGEGTKIYANTAGSDFGNDIFLNNYDSSNNDVTIQSIINIGSQNVTVPNSTEKYDAWHSDGTGHDFKVDSDLATIAAKTNMVAANGGYQPRNGSVGLTAVVAKPTLEPDDNYVAYYIPAGLSAPTVDSMFTTLQAAVDAVSSGEATEEKPIPSGGTIYLMADFAENVDIPAAVFTLDMNGHTVNGAMELRSILNLRAGADVTITDTASTRLTVTVPGSVDTEGNVIDPTTEERTVENYAHKQGGTGTLTKLDRFAEGTGIDMRKGSSLTVEKCVLEGFTAAGKSGVAIRNASGTLVLNEGTVIRNNTYSGTGEGGAVHVSGSGTATVNGGTYTGNKNTRGTGAAFRLTGVDKAAAMPTLTINGGTFSGNEAVNGGVIAAITNCEVNIYGGKFTDNKCTGTDKSDNDNKTGMGGVLYTYGSTNSANKVVIDGGEFDASKHVGEDRPEPNLLFADNYAAHGGAIFATLSTMTINGTDVPTKTEDEDPNNTLVFKNNTSYRGGVIFIGTGTYWRKGWINTINGGLFMDNEATYQGGVVFLGSHTLRVTGGEFFRNTAAPAGSDDTAGGGAIYRRDWDDNHIELTISGGEFHKNTAKYGGAIRIAHGSVTVTGDAEIYENKANIIGGAIFTPGHYTVIVSGMANIHNNQSVSNGGAIRGFVTMRDDSGNGTDCPKINNNRAGGNGGAIYGGLNMSVGEMCGNSGNYGGAVFMTDTSATVSGGVMNNNTARAGNGGAIWGDIWDYVYIKGGELSGNVAKKTSDGKEGHGGAIYNYFGITQLTGGTISENKAEGDGGAVWVYSDNAHSDDRYYANLPITGTKLVNNTARGNGGAICYGSRYSQGYLRLYGTGLITGNRAGNLGGGIYMSIAGQQYSTGPSRTEFNIGLFESETVPGTGAIYGNSAALGQDIYTVSGSKDDIIKATDMDLPEEVIANCWLDESNQRGIFNEIHGITNRYYALTLDYKVEKVVALLPLKTPAADGSTVKEFTSVQDAITFAQQNPDLIESAFLNNDDVDDNLPTLILVDDVKENITIPSDVKLTLNLNHHTISGQGTAITVNGTMNIRDEVMDDERYEGRFTKIDNTDPTKPVKVYGSGNDETKGTIEGGSNTTAGALKVAYGGKVTAYDGRIANSRSVDGGAGVYIANGTFTLDGATIENNVNSTGPAVYINTNASNFIMKSGLITGNKDSNGDNQGIIHNNGGSMSMTGGVIAGNTGNSVIYNAAGAKLSITGGSITNNTTRYGAIYVASGSVEIDGGLNQNVLIAGNTGSVNGGAMYVNDGTVFMSNALITGNSAPRGGGIYQNGGTITINEGLEITENSASVRGGGIFQNGGKLTMINGSVIANEAPIGGGIAQEAISSADAVVADGVKIFGNKSLQSAAGNDIYSAYEGTANWETITQKKSSITLEAVKDMRQTDLYNVWRDDLYTGDAYGTTELLGEGMYITGSIEKSNNLQLTTSYFDQAASEEPLSDNYRIDAVFFTNNGFQSGTYPISSDGKKTVTDTPENLGWAESTNPDDWYEDPTTGEIIKKRINPATGAAVDPAEQVPIIAEKKASEMGWPQSDETYTINIGSVPTTLHYLVSPDGKLYEQNQMVEWRPGDDCDRKNTLVMTNDTVSYGFSLALNQKDENKEQDINKARIWVEVELDADMSQAELKLATMTGGDTPFKGYVTTREGKDGKMVQVMRGYIDVTVVEGIDISGSFLMNVKDMHDKDTLKPKIRAWIEGDMENVLDAEGKPVTDSEGKPVQQLHVAEGNAERLTVSAAGKYNLSVLQNTGMVFTGYFDMANGVKVSRSEYEAVGSDGKPLNPNIKYGTMLGYGLTVMLYNDTSDEGKGIRGIELPADGLEFDVSLKGNLFLEGEPIVGSDGKQLSTTPVFWAGKENEPGTMGRPLNSTSASMNMNWNDEDDAVQNTPYAWNAAPYNSGNNDNSVYNGGGWQFMQATGVTKAPGEEIIHVKVNGYTFNIADSNDINPVNNSNGSTSTIFSSKFAKAFSAGYMQILYPYPAEEVADLEGYLSIENQTAAHDLKITTASGNAPVVDPGIGNLIRYFGSTEAKKHATNEMHYVDNYCSGTNGMFIGKQGFGNGDVIGVRNYYRTEGGGEIDGMEGGNGIAPLGTRVSIGATGSFTSMSISTVDEFLDKAGTQPNPYYIPDNVKNIQLYDNDEFNYLTAMNMLQKIDADAFTPVGGAKIVNQRVSMGQVYNGAVRVRGNESLPSWGTTDGNHPNPTTTMNLTVLYAAKPDGSNWDKVNVTANDMLEDSYYAGKYRPVYSKEEPDEVVGVEYEGMTYYGEDVVLTDGGIADMNKHHEEQLIYFETMDDLKAYFKAKGVSDPKCVGVLYQARDCCVRTGHELGFEVIAQITDDFAKTGKTYATTSDTRIWTTYRPEYRSYRASTSAERTSKLLYDFNWDTIPYVDGSVAKGLGLQNADGTPDQRTFVDSLNYNDPVVKQKMPDMEDDPDRTNERFYYFYKTGTLSNRYTLATIKDADGNEIGKEWVAIPQENTRHTLGINANNFCSTNTDSNVGKKVPYIKTEYSYGYHKGGTHNSWARGNSLLIHTLNSSIAIVVSDRISEQSNAQKQEYNLSNGDHLANFLVDPRLEKQSQVNNSLVTDGSQSTKVEIILDFPVGLLYSNQSIDFDYTPDKESGKDVKTYAQGELTWDISEVQEVKDEDGNVIGTRVIATTYVPDVTKRLPKITFAAEIDGDKISGTTTLNMKSSINATYEEYNSMAAVVQVDTAPIIVKRDQLTGIYHDLLTLPLDAGPNDNVYSSLVEIGEDFGYELTFYNDMALDLNNPAKNVRLADVLPYNNDGRNDAGSFAGGYTVKKIQVTFEGVGAAASAAEFATNGKVVYGGKHDSPEVMMAQNNEKGLTKDEKLSKAYNELLGTSTEPGLFDTIVNAGLSELLNQKKVNLGNVGTPDKPKYVFEYDVSAMDLQNLTAAVRNEYLSRLPEGTTPPSDEALDAAITAAIKEILGLTDEDLATPGINVMASDNKGPLIYVDMGNVFGQTTAHVNIVLNGARDVPVTDENGNPTTEHQLITTGVTEANPQGSHQTGGNSYTNSFGSNTNEALLKSQKDAVTVVERKLTGFVFLDMNHDGRFVAGDTLSDKKLANIEVWLYKVEDGKKELAKDVLDNDYYKTDEVTGELIPILTKADGSYTFNNVGPGDYIVEFTDPSGKRIDEKLPWGQMSVTTRVGDDGDVNTVDPFWTNANMNRCVPVYTIPGSGTGDTSASKMTSLTNAADAEGITVLAKDDPSGEQPNSGVPASGACQLEKAQLYANVPMPGKNGMKTATVISSNNNLGIYCIEARVEKQWTDMIEDVEEGEELNFKITGSNGYEGNIKLTQGESWNQVTIEPDENIYASEPRMTVSVVPAPKPSNAYKVTDNTRLPSYTWTSGTFYLRAENCNGVIKYKHVEELDPALVGYNAPEYKTKLEKSTGITTFWAGNTQRNHPLNIQKVDLNNLNKGLEGAKFAIVNEKGERLDFVPTVKDGKGVYFRAADNVTYGNGTTKEMEVDDNGMLKIEGLPEGNLYLIETKAPKGGYTKAAGKYKLVFGETGVNTEEDVNREGYDEDKLKLLAFTEAETGTDSAGGETITYFCYFKMPNPKTFRLPTTGGEGITTMLVTGLAAAAAGLVLLLEYRKRKRNNKTVA